MGATKTCYHTQAYFAWLAGKTSKSGGEEATQGKVKLAKPLHQPWKYGRQVRTDIGGGEHAQGMKRFRR